MKVAQILLRCACVLALLTLAACNESSKNSDGSQALAGSGGLGSSELPESPYMNPAAGTGGASGASSIGGVGGASGASGTGSAGTGGFGAPPAASGGFGGAAGTGSFPDDDASGGISVDSSEGGAGGSSGQVQSGTLTAGVWDDNRNFERFNDYRSELLQTGVLGETGTSGAIMPTTAGEHADAHDSFAELGAARTRLDIALVIDTTGSMGDELTYLQVELSAISQRIESDYPDAEQRWSVVVYRDEGDLYVTRAFDFTNNVAAMRTELLEQTADGGNDFPEAPDAALRDANALSWRTGDDVARLVFWVADAPHHDDKADELKAAVMEAQALGVHIYPVASSGIDELTELTMRSAAQLTGGRYLFLTSDSGVGGEHKEPTIPCYFVTKLDDAIIRMVDIEMSGTYSEPAEDEILRTGGDPHDGACQLEGGDEALVF